jgi:hypothetical protein
VRILEKEYDIEELKKVLVEEAKFLAEWNKEHPMDIVNIRMNTNTIRDILDTISHLYW